MIVEKHTYYIQAVTGSAGFVLLFTLPYPTSLQVIIRYIFMELTLSFINAPSGSVIIMLKTRSSARLGNTYTKIGQIQRRLA